MFGNFKIRQEAGGDRITDRQGARTFIIGLNKSYQHAPHWRRAIEAIGDAAKSSENEVAAGEAFKAALETEGGSNNSCSGRLVEANAAPFSPRPDDV